MLGAGCSKVNKTQYLPLSNSQSGRQDRHDKNMEYSGIIYTTFHIHNATEISERSRWEDVTSELGIDKKET